MKEKQTSPLDILLKGVWLVKGEYLAFDKLPPHLKLEAVEKAIKLQNKIHANIYNL